MPKFDGVAGRMQANSEAFSVLAYVRNGFRQLEGAEAIMQRYVAAPPGDAFKEAFHALFTSEERAELGAVIKKYVALATDLKTNHPNAVGYVPLQG